MRRPADRPDLCPLWMPRSWPRRRVGRGDLLLRPLCARQQYDGGSRPGVTPIRSSGDDLPVEVLDLPTDLLWTVTTDRTIQTRLTPTLAKERIVEQRLGGALERRTVARPYEQARGPVDHRVGGSTAVGG